MEIASVNSVLVSVPCVCLPYSQYSQENLIKYAQRAAWKLGSSLFLGQEKKTWSEMHGRARSSVWPYILSTSSAYYYYYYYYRNIVKNPKYTRQRQFSIKTILLSVNCTCCLLFFNSLLFLGLRGHHSEEGGRPESAEIDSESGQRSS